MIIFDEIYYAIEFITLEGIGIYLLLLGIHARILLINVGESGLKCYARMKGFISDFKIPSQL